MVHMQIWNLSQISLQQHDDLPNNNDMIDFQKSLLTMDFHHEKCIRLTVSKNS